MLPELQSLQHDSALGFTWTPNNLTLQGFYKEIISRTHPECCEELKQAIWSIITPEAQNLSARP